MRGIEARRRDTPPFICDAQLDMIKALSKASNAQEFRERIFDSLEVLQGYAEKLVDREVPTDQLIIAKRLSKYPERYSHNVLQAIAAQQLMNEGVRISVGQTVRYLTTDADNAKPNRRVQASELTTDATHYDVKKYLELLLSAAANILSPFGYYPKKLRAVVLYEEQQVKLVTPSPFNL